MINWLNVGTIKECNPSWPQIQNHPHWILTVRDPGFRKTNALLNLVRY